MSTPLTTTATTTTFPARPGTVLRLTDLPGDTRVSTGPTGTITVTVHGSATARAGIRTSVLAGIVHVTGTRPASGVTIRGNTITMTGGTIAAGQTVIGAIISGGRIVVNGVDVTDTAGGKPAPEPARIEITVPAGTGITVEHCTRTQVYDVAGPVDVALSGQGAFAARGATGAELDLSGQCVARLIGGREDVAAHLSGQSRVEIHDGRHPALQVSASGQSELTASGTFGRLRGHASGMSRITITGHVTTHALRTSGMSTATINGQVVTQ